MKIFGLGAVLVSSMSFCVNPSEPTETDPIETETINQEDHEQVREELNELLNHSENNTEEIQQELRRRFPQLFSNLENNIQSTPMGYELTAEQLKKFNFGPDKPQGIINGIKDEVKAWCCTLILLSPNILMAWLDTQLDPQHRHSE